MPGRLIDQRSRGGLMEIKIVWQPVNLFYGNAYILGIGAADCFSEEMPITAHVVFSGEAKFTYPAAEIGIDHHVIANLQFSCLCLARPATECSDLSRPIRPIDMR